MRRRERVLATLAIIFAFVGMCGLILLSIFDTKRHPSLHRVFLLVFILGVGLSAIFTVAEVSKAFPSACIGYGVQELTSIAVPMDQPRLRGDPQTQNPIYRERHDCRHPDPPRDRVCNHPVPGH